MGMVRIGPYWPICGVPRPFMSIHRLGVGPYDLWVICDGVDAWVSQILPRPHAACSARALSVTRHQFTDYPRTYYTCSVHRPLKELQIMNYLLYRNWLPPSSIPTMLQAPILTFQIMTSLIRSVRIICNAQLERHTFDSELLFASLLDLSGSVMNALYVSQLRYTHIEPLHTMISLTPCLHCYMRWNADVGLFNTL